MGPTRCQAPSSDGADALLHASSGRLGDPPTSRRYSRARANVSFMLGDPFDHLVPIGFVELRRRRVI